MYRMTIHSGLTTKITESIIGSYFCLRSVLKRQELQYTKQNIVKGLLEWKVQFIDNQKE